MRWKRFGIIAFVCSAAMAGGLARAAEAPTPGSTGTKLVETLQTHSFPITTESDEAQRWFDQGLVLLYGFNHGEAARAFTEAAARDPEAAMPWWGIAYANAMHINVPEVNEAQWKAGFEAVENAKARIDDETPLERALIEAAAARAAWPPPEAQRPLDEAYAEAMQGVHRRFGDNPDVAAQYAESLMNLQPWDYWTADLEPKLRMTGIVKALEDGLKVDPDHPQLCHLYIHALEAGPDPAKATAAAEALEGRVPGAGHLQHMPSHLYARVGRYADAATVNEAALRADDAFFEVGTEPGTYYIYHAHNLHFLAFAAMMEGRYDLAIAAARRLEKSIPDPALDQLAFIVEGIMPTTLHVMIRFGKWDDVLRETAPPEKRPVWLAVHHYARGIAFAALGRTEEARAEIVKFEAQVEHVPQDWWVFSNKIHDVLPIARHMLEGELAYREGRLDDAWTALEKASEFEDELVYDEPPGWMIPVRHAMGALLLEAGQPKRAEALYRQDQIDHPGNGWSLLGLKQALEDQRRGEALDAIEAKLDFAWNRVAKEDRPTSSCLCAPRVD